VERGGMDGLCSLHCDILDRCNESLFAASMLSLMRLILHQ